MHTATFIVILLIWLILFPLDALRLIRKLRTQHRQNIVQRQGKHGAKILSERLHAWAENQGFEANLVDELLAEHHDTIVQRLGRKHAEEVLSD